MTSVIYLLTIAILFRVIGTTIHTAWFPARATRWILCSTAGWLVASAVGAWSPWWPALVIATLATFIERYLALRKVRILVDVTSVSIPLVFSMPSVSLELLFGMMVAMFGLGFIIDLPLTRFSRQIRATVIGLFLVIGLGYLLVKPTAAFSMGKVLWQRRPMNT